MLRRTFVHSADALMVGRHPPPIEKPMWWTHPIAVPPSELELRLFQPDALTALPGGAETEPKKRYKPHPWFRNFGQNRPRVVDPPPRGEFFRFRGFWSELKGKTRELGVKGSLIWLVLQMRRQREAWYQKGWDSKLVGVDENGNRYWQSTYCSALQSRNVEFPDRSGYNTDCTVVSPEWYPWLMHQPTPNPEEIRQRFPDCFGKGLTGDIWYRMHWEELRYDGDRVFYPKGHVHPNNEEKFDDFTLRFRRIGPRGKGVMEFDPFVLPAGRLRKRQKWMAGQTDGRRHSWTMKAPPN